jgi:hypothetical protein
MVRQYGEKLVSEAERSPVLAAWMPDRADGWSWNYALDAGETMGRVQPSSNGGGWVAVPFGHERRPWFQTLAEAKAYVEAHGSR